MLHHARSKLLERRRSNSSEEVEVGEKTSVNRRFTNWQSQRQQKRIHFAFPVYVMIIHTCYLPWLLYQSQLLLLSGLNNSHFFHSRVNNFWDFPGGAVDRNSPANAENTGSTLGLRRSHMPQGYWARAPQEKPPQREACTQRLESGPC